MMQEHQAHQIIIGAVVHVMFIFSFFSFFWINNVKWHFVILCFCKCCVLCNVIISVTSLMLSLLPLCGEHRPLVTKNSHPCIFFIDTGLTVVFFFLRIYILIDSGKTRVFWRYSWFVLGKIVACRSWYWSRGNGILQRTSVARNECSRAHFPVDYIKERNNQLRKV